MRSLLVCWLRAVLVLRCHVNCELFPAIHFHFRQSLNLEYNISGCYEQGVNTLFVLAWQTPSVTLGVGGPSGPPPPETPPGPFLPLPLLIGCLVRDPNLNQEVHSL